MERTELDRGCPRPFQKPIKDTYCLLYLRCINVSLHRPPVNLQPPGRLEIRSGAGVYVGAVQSAQLFKAEGSLLESRQMAVIESGSPIAGRVVFSAQHDVADTLFQFPNISRPGVIQPEVIPNPVFNLGGNRIPFRTRFPL